MCTNSYLKLFYYFIVCYTVYWASLVTQMVKSIPALQETLVPSLGWKDPLEKGMTTLCGIVTWRIPWTDESMGHEK